MSTSAHIAMPTGAVHADVAERAAALVNPASGLANDYLDIFNEIVMMIDLLPQMPDLADDIGAWTPVTYRAYFVHSTLAGRERALHAYDRLDPQFRKAFERCAYDLSRAARAACDIVLDATARRERSGGYLVTICAAQADSLRARLSRMTDMVNSGVAPTAHKAMSQRSRRVALRSQRRSVGSSLDDRTVRTRA